jgi:hypothetical protein
MSKFFVHSLIDENKRNSAGWNGMVFLHDPQGVKLPCIGIVFEKNIEAGKKIFSEWIARLGKVDNYDELRIAIIEGDIPGLKKGYSVHLSSDPDNIKKRVRAEGKDISTEYIVTVSRVHRMTPQPGSPHLPRFKQEYAKHGRYYLIPVSGSVSGKLVPYLEYAIGKKTILFREALEITKGDVDSAVFPEGYFDHEETVH